MRNNRPLESSHGGLNRRIKDGTTDVYFNTSWQAVEEQADDGQSVTQNAWSIVYVDCMVEQDRHTDGSADQRLYSTQDANWNVTAVTNAGGTVQARYAYDAYGTRQVLDPTSYTVIADPTGFRQGFQGGTYEAALPNLILFRNRMYDTSTMRWLSEDPLGMQYQDGMSLYQAMKSNTVNYVDPNGRENRSTHKSNYDPGKPNTDPATHGGYRDGRNPRYAPLAMPKPGECVLSLRWMRIGPGYSHSYLVLTDGSGKSEYYRGGPSGSDGPASSVPASGIAAGGSSGAYSGQSSRLPGITRGTIIGGVSGGVTGSVSGNKADSYGTIETDSGPYVEGTVDWDPNGQRSSRDLKRTMNPCECEAMRKKLQAYADRVNQARVSYSPLGPNSNSFAVGAGSAATGVPVTPAPGAIGSFTPIPLP